MIVGKAKKKKTLIFVFLMEIIGINLIAYIRNVAINAWNYQNYVVINLCNCGRLYIQLAFLAVSVCDIGDTARFGVFVCILWEMFAWQTFAESL